MSTASDERFRREAHASGATVPWRTCWVSSGPPTASTRFSSWLAGNAEQLGVEWASELHRHYR